MSYTKFRIDNSQPDYSLEQLLLFKDISVGDIFAINGDYNRLYIKVNSASAVNLFKDTDAYSLVIESMSPMEPVSVFSGTLSFPVRDFISIKTKEG